MTASHILTKHYFSKEFISVNVCFFCFHKIGSMMNIFLRYISPSGLPRTFSAEAMNTFISLEYIATRLFLSNSFWNCIIYSVRNRHFRRAIVDVFICDEDKRRRRRSTIIAHSSSRARRDTNLTKTTSVGSAAGTTRG